MKSYYILESKYLDEPWERKIGDKTYNLKQLKNDLKDIRDWNRQTTNVNHRHEWKYRIIQVNEKVIK